MKILVQKFGGTSVATPESRRSVYQKIKQAIDEGYALVVVVSAMGRKGDPYATDTILDLIREEYEQYQGRELDMAFATGEIISAAVMTSYLNDQGLKSIALNGRQAGILTESKHMDADILSIDTRRILRHLQEGYIVVVTGGQGINEQDDFNTLGRGGSDTSAVAIANALKADETIIYTDVIGIMTTDPRIFKEAKLINTIDYEKCLRLADEGARVIHPRAVKEAMRNKSNRLYVRSTFSDLNGTLIGESGLDKSPSIVALTQKKIDQTASKVTLVGEGLNQMRDEILKVGKENDIKLIDEEFSDSYCSLFIDQSQAEVLIIKLHQALL